MDNRAKKEKKTEKTKRRKKKQKEQRKKKEKEKEKVKKKQNKSKKKQKKQKNKKTKYDNAFRVGNGSEGMHTNSGVLGTCLIGFVAALGQHPVIDAVRGLDHQNFSPVGGNGYYASNESRSICCISCAIQERKKKKKKKRRGCQPEKREGREKDM